MKQYLSGLYYANWTIYAKECAPIDLPYDKLTHLYYAFFNIDPTNCKVVHSDEYADLQKPVKDPCDPLKQVLGAIRQCWGLKKLNRNLKFIMSVGGYAQGSNFSALIDQPQKIDQFVDSIVEMVHRLGFDGVDVDYEFPDTSARMLGFAQLLAKLRHKLDASGLGYLITTAVPVSNDFLERLLPLEIDRSVDLWNIMCYDFVGEWCSKTGYHSNVYANSNEYSTWNAMTNYIAKGISPSKLALGMPLYGRVFRGCDSPRIGVHFSNNVRNPGTVLEPICDYSQLPIGQEYSDSDLGGCFCYDPDLKQLILYDTLEIVRMKVEVIQLLGLAGGFFWEASSDDNNPLRSLVRYFGANVGNLERSENHLVYE